MAREKISALTKVQVVIVVALIILAAGGGAFLILTLQTPSRLELAKNEALSVYGNIEGDFAPILKGFETKYPELKGKITYTNMGPPEVPNRIISEKKEGKPTADMIFLAYANAQQLQREQLLKPYKSKELSAFKPEFYDPNGEWAGAILLPAGFVYNTNLVGKNDVPKTLMDVTDAKWRGKQEIHSLASRSLGTQYVASLKEVVGDTLYQAFVNGLLQGSQPKANSSLFTVLIDVVDGKAAIGVVAFLHDSTKQKEQGKPIEFFSPQDIPLMTTLSVVSIIKDTKNPNLAELFEDYVLSAEGQTLVGNIQVRIPARTGVDAKYTLDKLVPNANIKIFPAPAIASNIGQIADDFKKMGFN